MQDDAAPLGLKGEWMKLFRFAGLCVIALALFTSTPAHAAVTCWKVCSGVYFYGSCSLSLAQCCTMGNRLCPQPLVWEDGNCTDGAGNYCP